MPPSKRIGTVRLAISMDKLGLLPVASQVQITGKVAILEYPSTRSSQNAVVRTAAKAGESKLAWMLSISTNWGARIN